jgi:hypothetical protein
MREGQRGRNYADPYVSGVGLGLVLLVSFVVTGRGLGASGAFASAATSVVETVSPGHVAKSPVFARYRDGLLAVVASFLE